MKCLLDSCTFLWIISGAKELSGTARELFTDPANEMLLSVVSVWEISVKHGLGRLSLPSPLDQFLVEQRERHGIAVLPLHEGAVLHLHKLPQLHRDPFDRMLICQAIEHDCLLLTPDPLISQYPVRTRW
ncbi:MAG: PIN domain protein [Nitrospira sp. OLB3]|nr:MAG: PIN domain protein [Nitrospira sp. OLB3]MEB2337520.1 type II toxin-antitoxin system VapC family toxin [Nitrospirales bacterium]QOJ35460.1 MAG: type II toxin-antitoxin system VapC family toxin [Nitrospira sp.]RIK61264.1 MAG: PIN domain nuclease [Nitrospira sp.]